MACWLSAQQWDFGCDNKPPCLCQNPSFLGSVLDCVRDRLEEEPDINDAYQYIQNNCKYNGKVHYTFGKLDDIYLNATKYVSKGINATQESKDHKIFSPIDIGNDTFVYHFSAAHALKRQYDLGTIFGCAMLGYWVVIMSFAFIGNVLLNLYPQVLFTNNKSLRTLRKHLTLPAMVNDFHSRPIKILFKFTVSAPTRGQSLILLGYFILNIVFLCVDYEIFESNSFLPRVRDQRLRYLGNRTGIIAFTQVPLAILFAGRNNILIKLTGWPYNTFQVYHRWVARMMILHTVIHSVCFTWLAIIGHTVAYRWQEIINWRFGNMATYISIIMFFFALSAFHSRFYEFFAFTHKCFFCIFIIGIARHCWDFGWMGWVWASIAVEVLERFLRFIKVVKSGLKLEAYAQLFPDDTFRMSVEYSKQWAIVPGQYCYIRILTKDLFWQAHPFSLYKRPVEGDDSIYFAIKARGGATKKIADRLRKQPNNSDVFRVLIEGPYGIHAPVENYDTVYLLGGGMGVTVTFSYAHYLKRLARNGQRVVFLWVVVDFTPLEWFGEEILSLLTDPNIEVQIYISDEVPTSEKKGDVVENVQPIDEESTETGTSKVNVYTGVGSQVTLTPIKERTEGANSEVNLGIKTNYTSRTHLTAPSTQDLTQKDGTNFAQQIKDQYDHILHSGRPNLQDEVSKFMVMEKGTMALVSCGPPSFIDYIRMSIVSNIKKTDHRVDYFEEAFSW